MYTLNDVGPYRAVNNENMLMSDEERQSIADEWNANLQKTNVPKSVTMRQAQEALLEDGTLDLVEATIDAMTGIQGRRAKIQWAKSQVVFRNWPLVIQLGPVIGKTPAQLDALFIKASTL